MAPIRKRLAINKTKDQDSASQNNLPTRAGVPSRYLEPPPEFNAMVTHATALRGVFKEGDRFDLVLSQQKQLIEKHAISVRKLQQNLEKDLEELWNTHKQEIINMKTEPLVEGEGSSQPPAIPRVMITCHNCMLSPATMVFLPCRHLCACTRCDKTLSRCPICNAIKTSSFSFDVIIST